MSDNDTTSVYLAGPVKEAEDSGAGWREKVKDEYGNEFDFIDPLDKYSPDDEHQPSATEIVDADLEMIDEADVLLVRYDGTPAIGTWMEVFYAAFEQSMPIAVTWTADTSVSPWVEVHADYIDKTVSESIAALRLHFTPGHTEKVVSEEIELYSAQDDVETAYEVREDGEISEEVEEDAEDALEWGGPTNMELPSGDEMASMVAEDVAALLTDSRDTHGDAVENQQHIAEGWTWYLSGKGVLADGESINGTDVGRMMNLVKTSRSAVGEFDVDHDRDIAGYATIAAACAVDRGDAELDELQEYADGGDQ